MAIASAEERGAEFFQEFPPSKATLAITISVEGGASLVIDAEQICLSGNSHGARNITVSHQLWGTFLPGAQQFRPNTGGTRFLPDGLDFSKATLSKRRISNRWGGQGAALPEFAAGSDRIRLGFLDHYDGAADFDLVISF